jgi:hypothetical protein
MEQVNYISTLLSNFLVLGAFANVQKLGEDVSEEEEEEEDF